MKENTRVVASGPTDTVYLPSESVVVPSEDPLTITFTPGTPLLSLSVTVPDTDLCWARAATLAITKNKTTPKIEYRCFIHFWVLVKIKFDFLKTHAEKCPTDSLVTRWRNVVDCTLYCDDFSLPLDKTLSKNTLNSRQDAEPGVQTRKEKRRNSGDGSDLMPH